MLGVVLVVERVALVKRIKPKILPLTLGGGDIAQVGI